MSFVNFLDLEKALTKTRETLFAATNGDGIVSRADLKNLLQQTEDPAQKQFIEFFYTFLLKLEDRPRMRVTESVIDRGIAFIKEQLIPKFEIREDFSTPASQEIAQTHKAALPMAMELLRYASSQKGLSPREVSDRIGQLTQGLFFDDYGSEAGIPIESFFLKYPNTDLTQESFIQALGLDPNTPKGKVARFESADRALQTFIEQHVYLGVSEKARTVVELMQTNLKDHTIIIVGEDNHPDLESNHPVYVVGIGKNGNLAGFSSVVIWT